MYTEGNTEAFDIGENMEIRRSPQAVACRKRYAVELGKPHCAPGRDDHMPGGLLQGGYMPMGCLIRHNTQRLGKPATRGST